MSLLDSLYNQERAKYPSPASKKAEEDKEYAALLESYGKLIKGEEGYSGGLPFQQKAEPSNPLSVEQMDALGIKSSETPANYPGFSFGSFLKGGASGYKGGPAGIIGSAGENLLTQLINNLAVAAKNSEIQSALEKLSTVVDLSGLEGQGLGVKDIAGRIGAGEAGFGRKSANPLIDYSHNLSADELAALEAVMGYLGLEGNTEGQNAFFSTGDLSGIFGTSSGE